MHLLIREELSEKHWTLRVKQSHRELCGLSSRRVYGQDNLNQDLMVARTEKTMGKRGHNRSSGQGNKSQNSGGGGEWWETRLKESFNLNTIDTGLRSFRGFSAKE